VHTGYCKMCVLSPDNLSDFSHSLHLCISACKHFQLTFPTEFHSHYYHSLHFQLHSNVNMRRLGYTAYSCADQKVMSAQFIGNFKGVNSLPP
jgi:hypothetical protein